MPMPGPGPQFERKAILPRYGVQAKSRGRSPAAGSSVHDFFEDDVRQIYADDSRIEHVGDTPLGR